MDLFEVVHGSRSARVRAQNPTPPGTMAVGKVRTVDIVKRQVTFVIDSYDPNVYFGPATYTPCPLGDDPVVGKNCLVIWPSVGIGAPWVVSWEVG